MTKSVLTIDNGNNVFFTVSGWFFCALFFAIGVINTCWGNDPGFGIFIILLSAVYIPPLNSVVKQYTGRTIPVFAKIVLAIFILWAALGVGELFAKINLMTAGF